MMIKKTAIRGQIAASKAILWTGTRQPAVGQRGGIDPTASGRHVEGCRPS